MRRGAGVGCYRRSVSNSATYWEQETERFSAESAARGSAVWIVLGSAVAAVGMGFFALWLVREQLHVGCGFAQMQGDSQGTWMCADGIGYLWVAVTLGGATIMSTIAGGLIAGLVRHERLARTLLVVLAGATAGWVLSWTRYGSSELVSAVPSGAEGIDYWLAAVLPAAFASGAGVGVGLIALLLPANPARFLLWIAAAAMLGATALQPGLALNTLPAAGLIAASAVRATSARAPAAQATDR